MIFYFSGTGNTKWVAAELAKATGESLVSMADELLVKGEETRGGSLHYHLDSGERLGFCFPTHGWQPPRIVREFVRRSTFEGADYVYAVTTCGDNMGDAMTILNKELAAKGLQAQTQFSVIMPESYVCLPFMYTDSEERVAEKVASARRQLPHIIDTIRQRHRGVVELERGAAPWLYSYVIGGFFNRYLVTDSKFSVDTDVCTRCGRCEKVCPVKDIAGTPPTWSHKGKCTSCLACYHHCPMHAIHFGDITRRRGQYYFSQQED